MTDAPLTLSSDILELQLSPSIGGAISDFSWKAGGGRRAILRESHTPLQNVLDASCFPLVPFVNRIRGGCFTFRGRQVCLSPNMAGDSTPLHGQGWTSPWRVESSSELEAVLAFDHRSAEWPWTYQARQHLRLEDNALHLQLTCRNTSDEPMPCGLGFHPYFPCGPDTRIETEVGQVWTVDKAVLPVALSLAAAPMHLLALIKPQFEAARKHSKRGIIRDASVQQLVCEDITGFAASLGCTDIKVFPSSIAGGDGNIEFFIGARRG